MPDRARGASARRYNPRVRRIGHGELLSAASALALGIAMFALKWFGVDGIPGRTRSLAWAENAWQGMPLVRWAMALTIVLAVAAPALHATQRSHGAKTSTSLAVLGLASLTSLLLIYRVLIDLPSSGQVVDQKLGAFLGVACALGIALGGYESVREERAARGSPAAHRVRRVDVSPHG
jgi:hypothetical protein